MLLAVAVAALVVVAVACAWLFQRNRALTSDLVATERRVHDREVQLSKDKHDLALYIRGFKSLNVAALLFDDRKQLVASSVSANELTNERHVGTLVMAAVDDMVKASVGPQISERDVEIYGPPPMVYFVSVVPLVDSSNRVGTLALIDDLSEVHRVDAVRRDFIANLSHELRTPIGAISLLAETVADEADPATLQRLSGRLVDESARLATSVDDLLELSRIEAGDFQAGEKVGLRSVIQESVARVRVAAEAAEIGIGVDVPDDDLAVLGDRRQLVSAVANLIDNAVKYSGKGDSVSVCARRDDQEVEIVVQDNGVGIPAVDLDRVFERFYRVDRSRRSETGGTGLGLAIVRHVALNHGGRVDVDSQEGDGSTFSITLPAMVSS